MTLLNFTALVGVGLILATAPAVAAVASPVGLRLVKSCRAGGAGTISSQRSTLTWLGIKGSIPVVATILQGSVGISAPAWRRSRGALRACTALTDFKSRQPGRLS